MNNLRSELKFIYCTRCGYKTLGKLYCVDCGEFKSYMTVSINDLACSEEVKSILKGGTV